MSFLCHPIEMPPVSEQIPHLHCCDVFLETHLSLAMRKTLEPICSIKRGMGGGGGGGGLR